MTQKNKNYFVYARKSTDRGDNQIESLPDQIRVLRRLANERGLKIVDIVQESVSAQKPYKRPRFTEMISRIQKGEATGIICWKLDRLARNPVDGGTVSWLLQDGTINEIVTPDKVYLPTDNVLMMSVELGMAVQYSKDLSSNVSRSIVSKFERGQYPSLAPLGYLNFRESKKLAYIVADPERFDLVRQMWQLMLSGSYNPRQICDLANEQWGRRTRGRGSRPSKKVDYSTCYKLFTNPFYAGTISYRGIQYKAAHEPMVSLEEFERVQELLGNKNKTKAQTREFPFTGSIRCSECGCLITAETKSKLIKSDGSTRLYHYYHCSHHKKDYYCSQRKNLLAQDLESQILAELEETQIFPEFYEYAVSILKRENQVQFKEKEAITARLHKMVESCDAKLERLLDAKLEGLIDSDKFVAKKEEINLEKSSALQQLDNAECKITDWAETLERAVNFTMYAKNNFIYGTAQEKKDILRALGQNLTMKDGILTVGDTYWREPFRNMMIQIKQKNARLEPAFSCSQNVESGVSDDIKSLWWAIANELRTALEELFAEGFSQKSCALA